MSEMTLDRQRPSIIFVLITVLLDVLGIGLIIPVLPQLVGDLAGSPHSQAWWLGAMMISYGAMQFIFAPTVGALSDRYGRRPLLLLGVFGLAIMFFSPALTDSLVIILISRILGGICSGNIAVAQAYIADLTPGSSRAQAFGKIGACFGIGFVLGPAIGGLAGETDVRLPFVIAGVLSLINFAYGWFLLPESLKQKNTAPLSISACNPFSILLGLRKLKSIGSLITIIAISAFVQAMLHSTWSLFTAFRYGWTPLNIGISLVAIGCITGLVQGFLLKPLFRIFNLRTLVISGLLSGSLAYFFFGYISNGNWAYLIIVLNFLSIAVAPTLNGLVSEEVPTNQQGTALGAVSSLGSISGVLAPLLGTPLLVHTSHMPAGSLLGGLLYFICSALLLFASGLAFIHFSGHNTGLKK